MLYEGGETLTLPRIDATVQTVQTGTRWQRLCQYSGRKWEEAEIVSFLWDFLPGGRKKCFIAALPHCSHYFVRFTFWLKTYSIVIPILMMQNSHIEMQILPNRVDSWTVLSGNRNLKKNWRITWFYLFSHIRNYAWNSVAYQQYFNQVGFLCILVWHANKSC